MTSLTSKSFDTPRDGTTFSSFQKLLKNRETIQAKHHLTTKKYASQIIYENYKAQTGNTPKITGKIRGTLFSMSCFHVIYNKLTFDSERN